MPNVLTSKSFEGNNFKYIFPLLLLLLAHGMVMLKPILVIQPIIDTVYSRQSIALSSEKIFLVEMVEEGIFLGVIYKQTKPPFFQKMCLKNEHMVPISRIGPLHVKVFYLVATGM